MSNSTMSVDPRIIPLVRSLKDQTVKPLLLQKNQDISSEKTSENSAKMKSIINKEKLKEIEDEKNKNDDIKKSKKSKNTLPPRFPNKASTMIRKKSSTKISIDGSVDNKMKSGTSDKKRVSMINTSNKIKVISKEKIQNLNPTSTFHLTSQNRQKKYNYNNIKTRSKYVQNLLSDMNIKKYKQNCIDIVKNDTLVKKLYEQAGFEKTNYSYEYFIHNNFFNNPLFMYKLEMLFMDESNFIKKNFKENFFKNEIVKYLNQFTNEEIYKRQMDSLQNIFKDGFDAINNFDLFHD